MCKLWLLRYSRKSWGIAFFMDILKVATSCSQPEKVGEYPMDIEMILK